MTRGKDSLFRFQGVDFGDVVAGDEAFSLCGKGLSFPPFSVPGIETHAESVSNYSRTITAMVSR